jgi:hypothetical protein
MTSEITTKLLKLIIITGVSVASIFAIIVLSIFAVVGANTVLSQGGSTIILSIPVSQNAPNILRSLGEATVVSLVSLSGLYLLVITVLDWLIGCILVLVDDLRKLVAWIKKQVSRIRIAPPETKP